MKDAVFGDTGAGCIDGELVGDAEGSDHGARQVTKFFDRQ
jgi:hypothetical protein